MLLHVGEGVSVPTWSVLAILDAQATSREPATRSFIERFRAQNAFRDVSEGIVGAYVVTDTVVYATGVSSVTLGKRVEQAHRGLFN